MKGKFEFQFVFSGIIPEILKQFIQLSGIIPKCNEPF